MTTLNSVLHALSSVATKLQFVGEAIVFGSRQDEMDLERVIARRRLLLERQAREARWEKARFLNPLH